MRIAMIGHKRIPSREGGIEVVVGELAWRMAKRGHDVTVYNRGGHNVAGSQYDGELAGRDDFWYRGVHVRNVPTLDVRGLAAASSAFFATRQALADGQDVIHFHAEGPSAMCALARWAGVHTVCTIHGLDWQSPKWGRAASAYLRHCEAVAARQADELVVLSGRNQRYFEETYGRKPLLIGNGIDVAEPVAADLITRRS